MRRVVLLIGMVGLAVPAVASAPAQVGTVTFVCPSSAKQGSTWRCTWTWTSDGSGNVSANPQKVPYGHIARLDTDPAAGGSAPTDNYDVTIVDTASIDVLAGTGANRDTATNESVFFEVGTVYHDGSRALDLVIANAGATKGGTVTVWIKQ